MRQILTIMGLLTMSLTVFAESNCVGQKFNNNGDVIDTKELLSESSNTYSTREIKGYILKAVVESNSKTLQVISNDTRGQKSLGWVKFSGPGEFSVELVSIKCEK